MLFVGVCIDTRLLLCDNRGGAGAGGMWRCGISRTGIVLLPRSPLFFKDEPVNDPVEEELAGVSTADDDS